MAILVDRGSRVLVQGITGRNGRLHTQLMLSYGTRISAGVTPGKAGEVVEGVSVYGSVRRALEEHRELDTSIIFVPAAHAPGAVYEAIDAGIRTIMVITEGIPVHDTIRFIEYGRRRGVTIVGPNSPGAITPGACKVGIMPGHFFTAGPVGIVSRSGTLTYEVAMSLTKSGLGQSTAVGIGGDPVVGLDLVEAVKMFEADMETRVVVVIGEIGGDAEERLAYEVERSGFSRPLVAYIAGITAPRGRRMGHAGAIISVGMGDALGKKEALRRAGVLVADLPSDVPQLVSKSLRR